MTNSNDPLPYKLFWLVKGHLDGLIDCIDHPTPDYRL
jgi:hypothetical protein